MQTVTLKHSVKYLVSGDPPFPLQFFANQCILMGVPQRLRSTIAAEELPNKYACHYKGYCTFFWPKTFFDWAGCLNQCIESTIEAEELPNKYACQYKGYCTFFWPAMLWLMGGAQPRHQINCCSWGIRQSLCRWNVICVVHYFLDICLCHGWQLLIGFRIPFFSWGQVLGGVLLFTNNSVEFLNHCEDNASEIQ